MGFEKTSDQKRAIRLLGGDARNVLLYGGSRSGKTFIALYALLFRAAHAAGSRHAILRLHANSVRQSIMNETLPKVMRLCFPELRLRTNRTDMYLTLPNRSEIWFGGLGADERTDKILGREFATLYFNECSELSYSSVSVALTRLAQRSRLKNRAFFDCNPTTTRHWTYVLFVKKCDPTSGAPLLFPDHYRAMQMNPIGNSKNLPEGYIAETLAGLSDRQRRRFLDGQFQEELEGALWKRGYIDDHRRTVLPDDLERVVVGVDPAVTSEAGSDLTGIVVCARDSSGHFHVLADRSLKASPLGWARAVCAAYEEFSADCVVGECNNGGDLIEVALHSVNGLMPFKKVTASRGKAVRAEPVAALYERGIVHHLGVFKELEEELCSLVPSQPPPHSPDRADALVWALTELLVSAPQGGGLPVVIA